MAQDDVHELSNSPLPPKSANDLMAWSETDCLVSLVVLVDERPVAYCGITDRGLPFLVPWAVTVQNIGLSKRRALASAIQVWEFLKNAAPAAGYANVSTASHKRSRVLLPWLGFSFTRRMWTSPFDVEFEWFTYGDVDV